MIKYISAFLFLMAIQLPSFAQNWEPATKNENVPAGHFVYLFDGTLLKPGDYTRKEGIFMNRFFYNNGDKIKFENIKYFRDEDGYYGNNTGQTLFGQTTTSIIKRLEPGALDLFREIDYNTTGNGYSSTSITYYFARGFDDMKLFSYENLKEEFTNNPLSAPSKQTLILETLETGKKQKKKRLIMIGAGIGTMLVGGIIYAAGEGGPSDLDPLIREEGNKTVQLTGLTITTLGLATTVSSLLFKKPQKFYMKAFKSYNEFY